MTTVEIIDVIITKKDNDCAAPERHAMVGYGKNYLRPLSFAVRRTEGVRMGEAVDVAAVVAVAALAGNELAIVAFVHPVLSRLDDATHTHAVQTLARVTGRAMPFWYAAAVLLAGAAAWVRPVGAANWWLAVGSAVLLAGSVVFTFVGPLPINNRVAKWDLAALPSGWRDDRRRWDWLHRIRVGVLIVAAVLLASAVAVR